MSRVESSKTSNSLFLSVQPGINSKIKRGVFLRFTKAENSKTNSKIATIIKINSKQNPTKGVILAMISVIDH